VQCWGWGYIHVSIWTFSQGADLFGAGSACGCCLRLCRRSAVEKASNLGCMRGGGSSWTAGCMAHICMDADEFRLSPGEAGPFPAAGLPRRGPVADGRTDGRAGGRDSGVVTTPRGASITQRTNDYCRRPRLPVQSPVLPNVRDVEECRHGVPRRHVGGS